MAAWIDWGFMSTKWSINSGEQWHLYHELDNSKPDERDHVHLELRGVAVTNLYTYGDGLACVCLRVHKELARELGLIFQENVG